MEIAAVEHRVPRSQYAASVDVSVAQSNSARGRLTARRWELSHAKQWLAQRRRQDSLSSHFAADFREAVARFFARSVYDEGRARRVIAQLGPTLSSCDELAFDHLSQALAYLVWHEVDRYHRVIQALDLLFERGVLPLAKPGRELRVLEVGSGPAPASYAAADYFAALGAWTHAQPGSFASSASVKAHTLDRAPAWTSLIHGLSEELLMVSRAVPGCAYRPPASWFFDVTYKDLQGFNPLQMHSQSRDTTRRSIVNLRYDDDDVFWPSVRMGLDVFDDGEVERADVREAPYSAYDLIILANFVTNEDMLQALESDLQTLARSLVPGGVLLTMSACGGKYQGLSTRLSALAEDCRLDHEVNEVLQAHQDPAIHAQVAHATIEALLIRAARSCCEGHPRSKAGTADFRCEPKHR